MPPEAFKKQSPAFAFDKAEGLLIGWLCFSDKDGAPYVDLHGDHFPADELFKAADELMAKPAAERMLNVEHAGGGVGEIRTVYAVTPEIAKAHGWDTGGTYGLVGSVKPDAALMKTIADGDLACFSIEGKAHDVEVVKGAGADVAATAHKRTMRKVSITKLALVKAGAHEGAGVALIKTATVALRVARAFAKATPALTDEVAGHQHLIHDIDESSGYTASEQMGGYPDNGWHSHAWVRGDGGSITIATANGHSHVLATSTAITESAPMPTDVEKTLTADLAKSNARISTMLELPPEQLTFAKRLQGAALTAFLDAPAAERTARATPIHKSERTGRVYYAGQEDLVTEVKDADAQFTELAKARDAAEVVRFEKAATDTIPHLKGTLAERAAIMKAVAGIADEAVRKATLETLKGADAAMAMLCKAPGVGNVGDPVVKSAQGELDAIATDLVQKNPAWSFAKASDAALETPRGRQLYAAIEAAKRNPAPATA